MRADMVGEGGGVKKRAKKGGGDLVRICSTVEMMK